MKRLHLDFSDGRFFYWLCECKPVGTCHGLSTLFNRRAVLLLRIANFFDWRAQRLLRREWEKLAEKEAREHAEALDRAASSRWHP